MILSDVKLEPWKNYSESFLLSCSINQIAMGINPLTVCIYVRMNSKMFSVSWLVQISSIMRTNKSEVFQWQTIIASIVVKSFQALLPWQPIHALGIQTDLPKGNMNCMKEARSQSTPVNTAARLFHQSAVWLPTLVQGILTGLQRVNTLLLYEAGRVNLILSIRILIDSSDISSYSWGDIIFNEPSPRNKHSQHANPIHRMTRTAFSTMLQPLDSEK